MFLPDVFQQGPRTDWHGKTELQMLSFTPDKPDGAKLVPKAFTGCLNRRLGIDALFGDMQAQ